MYTYNKDTPDQLKKLLEAYNLGDAEPTPLVYQIPAGLQGYTDYNTAAGTIADQAKQNNLPLYLRNIQAKEDATASTGTLSSLPRQSIQSSILGSNQQQENPITSAAVDGLTDAASASGGISGALEALGTSGAGGASEAFSISNGAMSGPLTAGQESLMAGGDGIGLAAALYNGTDAVKNLLSNSRRGKGAVEGATTLAGTTIGAFLGGPMGAGLGSIAGRTLGRLNASVGEKLGFIGGKSTKEKEQENWTAAAEGAATPADQEAAAHFYQVGHPEGDDSIFKEGTLAGRKWDWNEVQRVATGKDVWGSLGFFQTFPDWISGMSEQEREMIANAAMDHNLLSSSSGDLIFTDENADKIREIAAQVRAGTYEPVKTPEQRWADKQAYLQELANTQGYISEELGKPYTPDEEVVPDVSQEQTNTPQQQQAARRPRPQQPATPSVEQPLPAPEPAPTPPPIKTAQDYADAYMAVYQRVAGDSIFNPLNRSF